MRTTWCGASRWSSAIGDSLLPGASLATVAVASRRSASARCSTQRRPRVDRRGRPRRAGRARRHGARAVRGPPGTYRFARRPTFSTGAFAPDAFTGAIVLVGTTAKGLSDLRSTPLAPDFPGVEIHANLVAGMLNEELHSVPAGTREIAALIVLVAGLVVVFVLPWRGRWRACSASPRWPRWWSPSRCTSGGGRTRSSRSRRRSRCSLVLLVRTW